ncbi:MAG: flagellar basal body protein FliL, partial [Anaerolineae bacterium]|nr:flagellar basal body protein FliL [Anaerolineae bacterium]
KAQVREEVIARVNSALTSGEVRQVYFTEFVVQ